MSVLELYFVQTNVLFFIEITNFAAKVLNMSNSENKNNFDWVWYVIGMVAFVLAFSAVTTHIGYLFLAAIIGLIFGGVFLNKIVKGREY
jgi:chromate transport protein ChrA